MHSVYADKICVVTGAASGIGRALALRLAASGAVLAISDVNEAGLAETRAMLPASNRLRLDRLDVSDADAIGAYAQSVATSPGPADYLFNVAGLSRVGHFNETPLSSFERVIDVNFWGVVRMTKAFLPQLLETKGGIVNISSIYGLIGVPGQAHYCASKFAVRGFSESLAQELVEKGIRVTSVHPGGVATNIARAAEVDALPATANSKSELDARFEKVARMSPDRAAEIILKGAAKGKRRVMVGNDAQILSAIQRAFPQSYAAIIRRLIGDALS